MSLVCSLMQINLFLACFVHSACSETYQESNLDENIVITIPVYLDPEAEAGADAATSTSSMSSAIVIRVNTRSGSPGTDCWWSVSSVSSVVTTK